jgi:hemerythrin-like metal-binding protein
LCHENRHAADKSYMALFTWQSQYTIGIPEMDAEHEQLFALADALHASLGLGASPESVRASLSRLIDQTRAHFAHEEELMVRSRYPELERHKGEHSVLTEKALAFQRSFEPARAARDAEPLRVLRDWLTRHITISDRLLGEFLAPR